MTLASGTSGGKVYWEDPTDPSYTYMYWVPSLSFWIVSPVLGSESPYAWGSGSYPWTVATWNYYFTALDDVTIGTCPTTTTTTTTTTTPAPINVTLDWEVWTTDGITIPGWIPCVTSKACGSSRPYAKNGTVTIVTTGGYSSNTTGSESQYSSCSSNTGVLVPNCRITPDGSNWRVKVGSHFTAVIPDTEWSGPGATYSASWCSGVWSFSLEIS